MFSGLVARQVALTGWSLSIRKLAGNESFRSTLPDLVTQRSHQM